MAEKKEGSGGKIYDKTSSLGVETTNGKLPYCSSAKPPSVKA